MNKEILKRRLRILRRKKWPAAIAAILIAALIAAPFIVKAFNTHNRFAPKNTTALSTVFLVKADREKIHLTGHRGFMAQAPENTVASIEKAREYGFHSIEIDLRQTKDGVWVLSHDADVSAVTDKSGLISSYTYYDLITCTVDSGAHCDKYDAPKIPTLEQALKACLECNITPVLDIKDCSDDGISSLLNIIDKNGFTESCSIISSDMNTLEKIQKNNHDIKTYAVVKKATDKAVRKISETHNMGICFDGSVSKEKEIEKLAEKHIPLICLNVNDKETMKKYYKLGITDFITDTVYPM